LIYRRRPALSQNWHRQIAKLFGVTQPHVSDLIRGKIEVFGLDALVNMAAAAGLHVKLSVRKAA
jgi:predicted XRE-type DNA-binding protein